MRCKELCKVKCPVALENNTPLSELVVRRVDCPKCKESDKKIVWDSGMPFVVRKDEEPIRASI